MLEVAIVRKTDQHAYYEQLEEHRQDLEECAQAIEHDIDLVIERFVALVVVTVSIKELNWKEKDPVEDETDETEQHEAYQVVFRLEQLIVPNHGLDLAN